MRDNARMTINLKTPDDIEKRTAELAARVIGRFPLAVPNQGSDGDVVELPSGLASGGE